MNKNKKQLVFLLIKIVVIILVSIIALGLCAPIYFVVIRSFSPTEELFPIKLFPAEPTLRHFSELLNGVGEYGTPFSRNLFSSLLTALLTAVIQISVVCAAAYVLAKVKAPGIKALNLIIEWSIILSPLTLYVLRYFLMLKMGISDTYFAAVLPLAASPLAVFLVKGYMRVVPDEIIYCARLDGASHFRICFGIVMPVIKPAIIAVSVLTFGELWQYTGELFVKSEAVKPLSGLMSEFSASAESAGIFCALAAVITIPIIVLSAVFGKEIAQTAECAGIRTEHKTKIKAQKSDKAV